jgi:hypothetical protein
MNVEYSNKMLGFFNDLDNVVRKHKNVYLNMSEINIITEGAILYLLSRLHYYKYSESGYRISGNFPSNKECEKLLLESNFPKYVFTERKYTEEVQIFPIIDGYDSNGEVIDNVLSFVEKHINLTEDNSFDIYGPMLECLTNSKNHAYQKMNSKFHKWWLIAIPDTKHTRVHYTCLDNGSGIPSTIKKKFRERILPPILIPGEKDTDFVISALRGEFRTRTNKIERGKGLPSIFRASQNSQIANLTIISNFAYVKIDHNENISIRENMLNKFKGTLISWDFVE